MGLPPGEFWQQTPRTFAAIAEGFARRCAREHEGRAWHAWHVAALDRCKKLPKLRELMGRRRKRAQTAEEMAEVAKAWERATEGHVRQSRRVDGRRRLGG